ncbi:MAG: LbtU family siderophore porin, partial [Thermodesulfobacteriota bacterium]|nr:LbtU family siderophore porin [Thermodesulfobacteriota bacterium]
VMSNNALAMEESAGEILSSIHFSGLIEVGAAWQDVDYAEGGSDDASDLCLTTFELEAEAEVNEWVRAAALMLYEDATSFHGGNHESSFEIEEAMVTIGNTEKYPAYLTAGKMVVPFGALLTHFPDDPLMDVPVTLVMGETIEKAVLVGVECPLGFSATGYVFNGDVDEVEQENQIESYGLDVRYATEDFNGVELLVGASYISNLAESDGLEEHLEEALEHHGVEGIDEYVAGFDAYLHAGFEGFFVDVEYMTALDEFEHHELAANGEGAEPAVWNLEAGYNLDWGKNLEIVLKYAGSDEAGALEIPEDRYGLCLNQEIWEGLVGSVAYLHDEFESDDEREVLYAQIAVEF